MLKTICIWLVLGVLAVVVLGVFLYLLLGLIVAGHSLYTQRQKYTVQVMRAIQPVFAVLNDRKTSLLMLAPWITLGVVAIAVDNRPETAHLAGYFVHSLVFIVAFCAVLLRIPSVKSFFEHTVIKVATSLIFTGIFWYARARTAGDLTAIFHVDASLFSFTLYAGSLLLCLATATNWLVHAGMIIAIVAFVVLFIPTAKKNRDMKREVLNLVFFFSATFTNQLSGVASLSDSSLRNYALSRTAIVYDFSDNYNCDKASLTDRILFLGNSSNRALAVGPLPVAEDAFGYTFLTDRAHLRNLPRIVLRGTVSCNSTLS